MPFSTPEPLEREHHEIHLELEGAMCEAGRLGAATRAVAALLHPHFAKEDDFGLPPLGVLADLAGGKLPRTFVGFSGSRIASAETSREFVSMKLAQASGAVKQKAA